MYAMGLEKTTDAPEILESALARLKDPLCAWLRKHGATIAPSLSLKKNESERSVYTDARLAAEETIVAIPLECLLTVERCRAACPMVAQLDPYVKQLKAKNHTYLAVFILWDQRYEHRFQPYYDILSNGPSR